MKILRILKYLFLFVVGLALVLIAMANRDTVVLELVPVELAEWLGWAPVLQLPLFLVVMLGVLLGLLIGFVWEWLREHHYRAEASRQKRAAQQLEREVQGLKSRENEGKDEILALLDEAGPAR